MSDYYPVAGQPPTLYKIDLCQGTGGNLGRGGQPKNTVEVTSTNLDSARVFPNPWRSDKMSGSPVTFDHLTTNSTIKIFTVSGHWVTTLSAPGGSVTWSLRNDSGELVAPGLYLYVITNTQNQQKRGKLAIIR